MTISLYDISVRTYLQNTKALVRVLDKGRTHFEQNGKDLAEVVEARLYPDMLPLRFQVVSVVQHSLGAVKALEAGSFSPPKTAGEDYAALQELVSTAVSELKQYEPETVNGLLGKELIFKFGEMRLPFVAEDFILSFSLPNFFFHATTAYDILRQHGVPLGKADYIGPLRFKR